MQKAGLKLWFGKGLKEIYSRLVFQGNFDSVKLCDFGVALRLDENLIVCGEDESYVGTEPWSAKEVLQGGVDS